MHSGIRPPAPARWSVRRKLALQLALLPLYFLFAEFAMRAYLWAAGSGYDRAAVERRLESIAARLQDAKARPDEDAARANFGGDEQARSAVRLHPYAGYEDAYQQPILTDALRGLRGGGAEQEFRVLLLGGSVACFLYMHEHERIERRLAAAPSVRGRPVRILNFTYPGHKQPQQVLIATYLASMGVVPDAIVNLDGFNESALFRYNALYGGNPYYPFLAYWSLVAAPDDRAAVERMVETMVGHKAAAEALARGFVERGLCRSSLLGQFALARMVRIETEVAGLHESFVKFRGASEEQRKSVVGAPAALADDALLPALVANWFESSRSLQALATARGVLYLHVLQPTLHDAGSKPLTPEEVATGTFNPDLVEAVRAAYPRLREAGKRLAALGVEFLDASLLFGAVAEPIYYDHCHFNQRGNEILADALAERLVALLERRPARR